MKILPDNSPSTIFISFSRFLFLRFSPTEIPPIELYKFKDILETKGNKKELLNEAQLMVAEFIESKKTEVKSIELSNEEIEHISKLANILSIGRAKVKRDRGREVIHIHSPESPYRIIIALTNLYKSLICVNEDRERSKYLINKIVLDSIPVLRYKVISAIFSTDDKSATYNKVRMKIFGIGESKVRRTIEDMCLQRIIIEKDTGLKNTKYYSFTDEFSELMKIFE